MFCDNSLIANIVLLGIGILTNDFNISKILVHNEALKSRNHKQRIQSVFSYMDIHLEEINLQNVEKHNFNSSNPT